jgi:hypothetical protein
MSAYGLADNFASYTQAAARTRSGIIVNSTEFGWLGTPGFGIGAFLKSPFASSAATTSQFQGSRKSSAADMNARETKPDIQITLYPNVIEPHVVALEKHKRTAPAHLSAANQRPLHVKAVDEGPESEIAYRRRPSQPNQYVDPNAYLALRKPTDILISISLLYPDAEMQVIPSTTTHNNPRNKHSSGSGGGNNNGNINSDISSDTIRNPQFVVTTPPTSETSSASVPKGSTKQGVNYLSSLDVQRLAWGVETVRQILSTATTDASLNAWGTEISPGLDVTGDNLLEWVGHFIFTLHMSPAKLNFCMQINSNVVSSSHYIGSASMGPTVVPPVPVRSNHEASGFVRINLQREIFALKSRCQ